MPNISGTGTLSGANNGNGQFMPPPAPGGIPMPGQIPQPSQPIPPMTGVVPPMPEQIPQPQQFPQAQQQMPQQPMPQQPMPQQQMPQQPMPQQQMPQQNFDPNMQTQQPKQSNFDPNSQPINQPGQGPEYQWQPQTDEFVENVGGMDFGEMIKMFILAPFYLFGNFFIVLSRDVTLKYVYKLGIIHCMVGLILGLLKSKPVVSFSFALGYVIFLALYYYIVPSNDHKEAIRSTLKSLKVLRATNVMAWLQVKFPFIFGNVNNSNNNVEMENDFDAEPQNVAEQEDYDDYEETSGIPTPTVPSAPTPPPAPMPPTPPQVKSQNTNNTNTGDEGTNTNMFMAGGILSNVKMMQNQDTSFEDGEDEDDDDSNYE